MSIELIKILSMSDGLLLLVNLVGCKISGCKKFENMVSMNYSATGILSYLKRSRLTSPVITINLFFLEILLKTDSR